MGDRIFLWGDAVMNWTIGISLAAFASLCLVLFTDTFFPFSWKNSFALFFYFLYTILLNMIIAASLIKNAFPKKRYFIR